MTSGLCSQSTLEAIERGSSSCDVKATHVDDVDIEITGRVLPVRKANSRRRLLSLAALPLRRSFGKVTYTSTSEVVLWRM